MIRKFVAIQDPLHELARRLTRETPLAALGGAEGRPWVEYEIDPEKLPESYYVLAGRHALQGLPYAEAMRGSAWKVQGLAKRWLAEKVNYFDATRLDRRCQRDLRLRARRRGPGLLAAELISFGTGLLRAANDHPADPAQARISRRYGRLESPYEFTYARIRALAWNSLPLLGSHKETFESSNVILGDALGELEQLWERRADTAFLDAVARVLQPLRRHGEITSHLCPPLHCREVMRAHLAQGIWKQPPANGRALLRRIEKLLNSIIIDSAPRTRFGARAPARCETGVDDLWERDASGYDGWLSPAGLD